MTDSCQDLINITECLNDQVNAPICQREKKLVLVMDIISQRRWN